VALARRPAAIPLDARRVRSTLPTPKAGASLSLCWDASCIADRKPSHRCSRGYDRRFTRTFPGRRSTGAHRRVDGDRQVDERACAAGRSSSAHFSVRAAGTARARAFPFLTGVAAITASAAKSLWCPPGRRTRHSPSRASPHGCTVPRNTTTSSRTVPVAAASESRAWTANGSFARGLDSCVSAADRSGRRSPTMTDGPEAGPAVPSGFIPSTFHDRKEGASIIGTRSTTHASDMLRNDQALSFPGSHRTATCSTVTLQTSMPRIVWLRALVCRRSHRCSRT
jgi:hypothetical protein